MNSCDHSRFGLLFILVLICAISAFANASDFRTAIQPLIDASCVDCHDGSGENGLDFGELKSDLKDDATFRKWERIFDRVSNGEMPPASEARPDPERVKSGLSALEIALIETVRDHQLANGRTILRRLNRTEYAYTLRDLFGFDRDVSAMIPAENVSPRFDTVFDNQGFSPLHVESFLTAADSALTTAIEIGRKPESKKQRFLYREQKGIRDYLAKEKKNIIIKELDDAVVMFSNATYIFKLQDLDIEHDGRYRIRCEASAYQSDKPVILSLNAGNYKQGSKRMLGFFDLPPGESRTIEVEATLRPGEYLFPDGAELQTAKDGQNIWNIGAKDYQGSGIALKWIEVEGPIEEKWPPRRVDELLQGIEVREREHIGWDRNRKVQYELVAGDDPKTELTRVAKRLAPRAFRRPLQDGEASEFVELGMNVLAEKRSMEDAVRVVCRGILNSPEFIFMSDPPGPLNGYALAERLSYFLWKSMPDATLFRLARKGSLSKPQVLREQVERMLKDAKSQRFVDDFVGQWLRLVEINATSPDAMLYPEFEGTLKSSMQSETREFVGELIREDLSTDNLIDSEFAMLNRRMAEHYDIDGVKGQHFRKVALPKDSLRGGILTHASVLKVTANGTVTSPVRRGSWVLTHLLGQPPSPPPPGIGSVEPDTRGTTTIREELAKHRNNDSCASCHQTIDPPGFAMECFDVIGGYRERYRSVGEGDRVEELLYGRNIWEYKHGLAVDSSGECSDGRKFEDINEYKRLLASEKEQVARNVIAQLLVYATGAEIQFADREVVEEILKRCEASKGGMRTMIHEVVQSRLFRNK